MAERYAVSFTINRPGNNGLALLWDVRDCAMDWFSTRYRGVAIDAPTGEWHDENDKVLIVSGEIGDAGYWRLEWEHPDHDRPRYRWRTDIRFATDSALVETFVEVQLVDTGRDIQPEGINVDRPTLVSQLVDSFECDFEGHLLTSKLMRVTPDIAETFTRNVILHPQRRLPVVVVTADANGTLPLDPARLQSRLAGLATVAEYAPDATWALTDSLGYALTCFGGAIRVYWPGVTTDNPVRHRRWLPEHARELGPRLSTLLLHLFVSRFGRYVDHRLYDDIFFRARRAERDRTLERLGEASGADDAYLQLLSEMQEQLDAMREKLDRAEARARTAESENRQHRQNYQLFGVGLATAEEDEDIRVDTVEDAVKLAQRTLPSLRFLPSALESAGSSRFYDPAGVYSAFETLEELAKERRKGVSLGMSIETWLAQRGVEYAAHESQTAMTRWRQERTFRDGDHVWTMEERLKFGADGDPQFCLRVYLAWDAATEEWVVGHVGRHLTTLQS